MLNKTIKFLFKVFIVIGVLVIFVYMFLFFFIYSRTPEQAIQKKLGNIKMEYKVNNDQYIDKDGSYRFYISELNGKFTDSIPHIFYLKKSSTGWYVANYGNAP